MLALAIVLILSGVLLVGIAALGLLLMAYAYDELV